MLKHPSPNACYPIEKRHARQIAAIGKCPISDVRYAGRNRHVRQATAIVKRIISDARHAVRNHNARKFRTPTEHAFTDDRHVIRNNHIAHAVELDRRQYAILYRERWRWWRRRRFDKVFDAHPVPRAGNIHAPACRSTFDIYCAVLADTIEGICAHQIGSVAIEHYIRQVPAQIEYPWRNSVQTSWYRHALQIRTA